MSSMLDQAIVDAKALREAAIQSAEQAVVSRYSEQIKNTVESLLEKESTEVISEQEEQGESYGDNTQAPVDEDEKSIVEAQLDEYEGKAYAFGDLSDDKNFELEEDQEIEIDLEKIVAESKGSEDANDSVEVTDELIEKVVNEVMEEVALEEGGKVQHAEKLSDDDDDNIKIKSISKVVVVKDDDEMEVEEEEEPLEEDVIEEKMKLDYKAQPAGWMGRSADSLDEETSLHLLAQSIAEMEYELTKEHKEINDLLNSRLEEAKTEISNQEKENARLSSENKTLYEAVESLKTKFDEMTLINAKLLYTNKVLSNGSLNERQKNEIVESIQNTDSVEKAKVVYETLQSAVGTSKTGPKSLSEAVGRRTNTSMLLKAKQPEKSDKLQETFADRMKALAGIRN